MMRRLRDPGSFARHPPQPCRWAGQLARPEALAGLSPHLLEADLRLCAAGGADGCGGERRAPGDAAHGGAAGGWVPLRSGAGVVQGVAAADRAVAGGGSIPEAAAGAAAPRQAADTARTATIARAMDPAGPELEAVWNTEWHANLLETALKRVKGKVSARQYQIFDCYVVKEWPAQRVQRDLGVNLAQVYLAKHRVAALLKKEVEALQASSELCRAAMASFDFRVRLA